MSRDKVNSKFGGHIYAFIANFIVSTSFIFIEELKNVANPLFLVFCRFFLASILLCLIVLIFYRKDLVNLPRLFLKTSVVGFFYATYFVLQIYAQKNTSVLNVSSIHTLTPFLTYLFMLIYLRNKISIRKLSIFLLAMVSTLWIVFNGDINAFLGLKFNSGDLICFFAIVSLVLYVVSMNLVYKGERAIILTFGSLVTGTLFLLIFMFVFDFKFEFNQITMKSSLALAYLIIFSTVVSMFLYQKATIIIGAVSVSSYIYLAPSIVLVLAWVLYGSIPSISVIIAVIFSCFATLLIQTKFFQASDDKISE